MRPTMAGIVLTVGLCAGLSQSAALDEIPGVDPQVFADQFGWEEMVAKVAQAYRSLAPEERAKCVLYAHNYGEAAAIDFYGPKFGLPRAASGHNNYFLWGPPDSTGGRGGVVITIGESR